jgi:hypothetical protein
MKRLQLVCVATPLCLIALSLTGCAIIPPSGPTVVALPPKGESLNTFQQEDYACREYAFRSDNASQSSAAAANDGLRTGAIGTAGGAAAGARLGAAAGDAGIGAGAGLLFGGAVGANGAQATSASLQARYDAAYSQCMAAKGNQITHPASYATAPAYATQPVFAPAPAVVYGYPQPFGYW